MMPGLNIFKYTAKHTAEMFEGEGERGGFGPFFAIFIRLKPIDRGRREAYPFFFVERGNRARHRVTFRTIVFCIKWNFS